MTLRQIEQTIFRVEPLKNIVGVGDITAYQIVIHTGPALGFLGTVNVPAHAEICNDPVFTDEPAAGSAASRMGTWFRRSLATLGF
jgi:hypothetical protein